MMAAIHCRVWSSAFRSLRRPLPVHSTSPLLCPPRGPKSFPIAFEPARVWGAVASARDFTSDNRSRSNDAASKPSALRSGYKQLKSISRGISALGKATASLYVGLSTATGALNAVYVRVADTAYGRLMRLDKPTGTHLLFLPGAWAISLASTSPTNAITLTGLFYAGSVLMRGAGCTVNDIWDADIDRQVARTKTRPIAAGEVSSAAASALVAAQVSGAAWILTKLNTESFIVATSALLPVLFYPLAKRHTTYPQAALGLTFNWGALLGYTAATGTLGVPALWLYGAGWCWTMVYDTLYAFQDKADDEKVGVKSTARTFGEYTKPVLAGLTAGKFAMLAGAGMAADLSTPYYVGVSAATIHLAYQVFATDLRDPKQCGKAFRNNSITGAITWASIIAGRIF